MPDNQQTVDRLAHADCGTIRDRNARGDGGLDVLRTGGDVESWTLLQFVPLLPSSSFLAFDRAGQVPAGRSGSSIEVRSPSIDPAIAQFNHASTWSTQGQNPIHLAPNLTGWAPIECQSHRFPGMEPAGTTPFAADEDTDTITALAINLGTGALFLGEQGRANGQSGLHPVQDPV